jgi:hypothetical protein
MQDMQEHSATTAKTSPRKTAKTAAAKKATKPPAKALAGARTSAVKTKR